MKQIEFPILGSVNCIICGNEYVFRSEVAWEIAQIQSGSFVCVKCKSKQSVRAVGYVPEIGKEIVGCVSCNTCKRQLPMTNKIMYDLFKNTDKVKCYSCTQAEQGKWKRVCRVCLSEMIYTSKHSFLYACKHNGICRGCANRKKKNSYEDGITRLQARREASRKWKKEHPGYWRNETKYKRRYRKCKK